MITFARSLFVMALALLCTLVNAADHGAPAIVAHRAGTADAPENTLVAINNALKNGADAIWITLQQSKDGVIVLYRPVDLHSLTDKAGAVSLYTADELANIDSGWAYGKQQGHPFRGQGIGIPRLRTVLERFPNVPFYLDIKSPDADPTRFAHALLTTLKQTDSLKRTRVYSTDARYLNALPKAINRFESRDATRTLLANITMAHQCDIAANGHSPRWYGLERVRDVEVVEKYTLGEGRSKAKLVWDKESIDCFRSKGHTHIILFGINTAEDYQQALALGVDGVMVDSPLMAQQFRTAR